MTTKGHLAQHDKQIAAIRKLVQEGMKLVVDNIRQTRKDLRDLHAAQRRTEASLKAFIDSMRGGGNGRTKAKMDL